MGSLAAESIETKDTIDDQPSSPNAFLSSPMRDKGEELTLAKASGAIRTRQEREKREEVHQRPVDDHEQSKSNPVYAAVVLHFHLSAYIRERNSCSRSVPVR